MRRALCDAEIVRSARFLMPSNSPELSLPLPRISYQEDAMKAYLNNLPARTWALVAIPLIVIAYPIAAVVVPAVIRAVVPEVVRTVLSLI